VSCPAAPAELSSGRFYVNWEFSMPVLRGTIPKVSRATGPAKDLLERARQLALKSKHGDSLGRALALLQEAAGSGSEEADYAIGTWYAFGKCLPKNEAKAVKHFKRAARKKYGPAMFDLAVSYETGRGVQKDPSRAFSLYVQAAREGDLEAAKSVYRCLYHGIGVARNRPIAELVADLIDGTFARKRKQVRPNS
jgi:TPR repeat protein